MGWQGKQNTSHSVLFSLHLQLLYLRLLTLLSSQQHGRLSLWAGNNILCTHCADSHRGDLPSYFSLLLAALCMRHDYIKWNGRWGKGASWQLDCTTDALSVLARWALIISYTFHRTQADTSILFHPKHIFIIVFWLHFLHELLKYL